MKSYNINQKFQITLSQILQNPINQYKLQSDSSILVLRQGPQIDIHFCNPDFTTIQNSLAIQGVKTLRRIRVTYFALHNEAIIIYQKQNLIHFYRGKVPIENQNHIKSSITELTIATHPWDDNLQILQISQIWLMPKIGVHCMIKTNQGSTYLLQYQENQRKLTIKCIEAEGVIKKLGGAFRYVLKPFLKSPPIFSDCSTFIYQMDNNQNILILQLLDTMLLMKNLLIQNSSRYNHQLKSNWQIDLKQYLQTNSIIINSIFVFNEDNQKYSVSLFVVCCVGASQLTLHCFVIDFECKIQKKFLITNLFEEGQTLLHSRRQPDSVIMFNKYTDSVDMEQFGQKLYIFHHNKSNMMDSLNKKKKVIAIIEKTSNNQLRVNKIKRIRIPGEIRLFKLENNTITDHNNQMEDQNNGKLLLLGESDCFQIGQLQQFQSDKQFSSVLGQSTIKRSKIQRIGTYIPPIPSYNQNLQSQMQEQKQILNQMSQTQSKNNHNQYLNPFSTYKIFKCISNKDYGKLFEMFQQQKEQFAKSSKKSSYQQDSSFTQALIDQLFIQMMFGLFTRPNALNWQLQVSLVKQIFHQRLYKDKLQSTSQKLINFIQNLFEKKDTKNLESIINIFFQCKLYNKIYYVCAESIPNFLESQIQNNKLANISASKRSILTSSSIESLKIFIKLNYLAIYERLIEQIFNSESKIPEFTVMQKSLSKGEKSQRALGQYQLKQVLQKYLIVKKITQNQYEGQNYKTQELNEIFNYYLREWDIYGKFLIAMAIKYHNITLFDILIKNRKISKDDLKKFLSLKQISRQTSYVHALLVNLVNKQLQNLTSQTRQPNLYNLKSLSWIPTQYFQKIYEHLVSVYPKVAIMYGIKQKTRRKVAKDISNRVQLKLFHTFKSPSDALELYQPLYSYFTNAQLRLNIDLARLFIQIGVKQFIQAKRFIDFQQKNKQLQKGLDKNKEKIQIQKQKWANFQQNISQYLNENQIKSLRQHFTQL